MCNPRCRRPAGELCEVDVDECESQPCQNGGRCEDGRASYACRCPEAAPGELPWGGAHCGVELSGCVDHECQNGATCRPWLRGGEPGHACLCPHGFYDQRCSTSTTFSFSAAGFIHLQVAPEELQRPARRRLAVQLRFRTTLPGVLLFFRGDAQNHLSLEIVDRGLRAKAFSQEAELGVALAGPVSDGDWRDARVSVDHRGLVLVLKGPGCDGAGCSATDGGAGADPPFRPSAAFAHLYVGGAPEELLELSASGAGFIGCMEDLAVDSRPVLPQTLPEGRGHQPGCSKTDWCRPAPCGARGRCVDLWTGYRCDCYRPYHGQRCSEGTSLELQRVCVAAEGAESPIWTRLLADCQSAFRDSAPTAATVWTRDTELGHHEDTEGD